MDIPATTLPNPATDKPPRRRLWIPLSLRMFLVILVILGVSSTLLTWVSYHREQQVSHREQQVIHEIRSWGGSVGSEAGGNRWLRLLAGKNRPGGVKLFERI